MATRIRDERTARQPIKKPAEEDCNRDVINLPNG